MLGRSCPLGCSNLQRWEENREQKSLWQGVGQSCTGLGTTQNPLMSHMLPGALFTEDDCACVPRSCWSWAACQQLADFLPHSRSSVSAQLGWTQPELNAASSTWIFNLLPWKKKPKPAKERWHKTASLFLLPHKIFFMLTFWGIYE